VPSGGTTPLAKQSVAVVGSGFYTEPAAIVHPLSRPRQKSREVSHRRIDRDRGLRAALLGVAHFAPIARPLQTFNDESKWKSL